MRSIHRPQIQRSTAVIGAVCGFLAASTAIGQTSAPESCPAFPVTGGGLALLIVVEPDRTLSDCKVNPTKLCPLVYDPRPGFLCISLKADARPTLTAIEGPNSSRVDRVFVDGQEFTEGAPGYPHLHLRDVIGTGPSGATYDIVVHSTVASAHFATTLAVTAEADRQVTFNALQVEPLD